MATVRMMQGDSYPVYIALSMQDTGDVITPNLISDVEVSVGESLRKTYSAEEVFYDNKEREWFFIPTQEDTFGMDPGNYEVQVRVKLPNGNYSSVRGLKVGTIIIMDANSSEVI